MEKDALLERLVRLARQDIPGTPRWVLPKASPQDLAHLQGTVGSLGGLKPKVEGFLHRASDKVFTDRVAQPLKKIISTGVQHPDVALLQAAPLLHPSMGVPGITEGYMAGKVGLEKLIDKFAPLPKMAADGAEEKKKALLGTGLAAGSFAGSTVAGHHVMRAIQKTPHPESLSSSALFHKVRSDAPVPVTHAPLLGGGALASGEAAPMYNLESKEVHFPRSSSHAGALAHEFGHADIAKSRMGRLLQNKTTLMMGAAAPGIGIASGALTADSDNPNVRRLGIAAPALAALPMLGYEGLASLKGVGRMRNAGAAGKELWRASKDLLPAWGSYLGRAGMGVGSAMLAQHGLRSAGAPLDEKQAFATSQYSGALNPSIPSQASHLPGFLAPNLQSAVQKRKQAAGAPTRGNFMMASDIPSFNPPDLQSPIQKRSDMDLAFDPAPTSKKTKEKDSDMLPDYVTYNAGDFKKSKYAMPTEEMAKFVASLREKMAGAGGVMGVSPSLSGASSAAKSVGAPKLSGPGPSIAQIAKPKGPHFGTGIAGAFKGSIGGRAPQDLS